MIRRLLVVLVALALAGCTAGTSYPPGAASAAAAVLGDGQIGSLVSGVVQRTPKQLDAARLAPGLAPPTNRWYSGLVFGDEPQPVFPLPLSFGLTADGFAFGLPTVKTTPDSIFGGYAADVPVTTAAASSVVTSDDPSVVTVEQRDSSGAAIGQVTIAQGWPFVAWTAARDTKLIVPAGFGGSGDVRTATLAGKSYALKLGQAVLDGTNLSVPSGATVVFWAVPDGHQADELAALAGVPSGSEAGYEVADQVTTTLTYPGAGALARLPHQGTGEGCDLGTYPSSYGTMTVCRGDAISWTTSAVRASATLDLTAISSGQKGRLVEQLAADADAEPTFPTDTYYGGKALQRQAMLLMVADQLGQTDVADRLATVLDKQLSTWTQPQGCAERDEQCFVYDPAGRGIVGLAASFGSDEYNDHHFHYGYFLFAAAVMAAHDPSAVSRYAPVMNLLAADIGSFDNSSFPDRRNFDPYSGHSWASGTAPFADGNNQESVAEAVNAYAGLSLWAQAIGDHGLAAEANWMLALEAQSSGAYWTNPDLGQQVYSGYGHKIVSLNWGGKRDYATWFSPAPAAKLGILLLPMSPTSTYLAGDPARIRANVAEATGGDVDQKFGDYLLMYSALAGADDRDAAIAAAEKLPDADIDDGMSRTYLLAWLYALRT